MYGRDKGKGAHKHISTAKSFSACVVRGNLLIGCFAACAGSRQDTNREWHV